MSRIFRNGRKKSDVSWYTVLENRFRDYAVLFGRPWGDVTLFRQGQKQEIKLELVERFGLYCVVPRFVLN